MNDWCISGKNLEWIDKFSNPSERRKSPTARPCWAENPVSSLTYGIRGFRRNRPDQIIWGTRKLVVSTRLNYQGLFNKIKFLQCQKLKETCLGLHFHEPGLPIQLPMKFSRPKREQYFKRGLFQRVCNLQFKVFGIRNAQGFVLDVQGSLILC